MNTFPLTDAQVLDFTGGNESVLADHYNELYDHYLRNGEMPYGVAKARTGDPDQFIADKLYERGRYIKVAAQLPTSEEILAGKRTGDPAIDSALESYASFRNRGELATYENPIWYRGYRIFAATDGCGPRDCPIKYIHDDYDPTPVHADDGPSDQRCGYARDIAEARAEIDELEDEQ